MQPTSPPSVCWPTLFLLAAAALPGRAAGGGPAPFMMRTIVAGQMLEGQPLAWTDREMVLLGRDSALYKFDPRHARQSKKTGGAYRGFSTAEMKQRLRGEFDATYEVTATQHFVVVHPRGPWQAWAARMETFYRSFIRYMSVRGFRPRDPATPLPAIVFRNQADYYRHAAESGTPLAPGSLGHYSPWSNRVYLFDISGTTGDADQIDNFETIIHEATHQTAYNVGVHQRLASQPRWLVEGLAMMFEARGVYANSATSTQGERVNHRQRQAFQQTSSSRSTEWLVRLVSWDASFDADPAGAYAESWALAFYLCESRPQQFAAYLADVARRPAFSDYPPATRLADFQNAFGSDLALLDAQLRRFAEQLP